VRRHQVARSRRRLLGVLLGPLLAGCVTAGTGGQASQTAVGVTITSAPGETLAFEPLVTTVSAGRPIAMTFQNASDLAHNLTFTDGLTAATRTIVEPGASDALLLDPPGAGEYRFICTIHDGMTGTLIVRSG
jgi:plastocyanin